MTRHLHIYSFKIDDVRNYEEEGKENTDVSNIVMPNVNITAIENHNETSTSIGFHNSENLFPPMPPLVSNIDNNFNSTILSAANVRTIAAQRWLNVSNISFAHTIFARAMSYH